MSQPRALHAVYLVLTARCNLTCGYCYQNTKQDRVMSWDTLRRSLDWTLASAAEECEVVFFGGEPLLEFDLIRRGVAYVEERAPGRLAYGIVTNGTLLRDERLEFLVEHEFRTQLSFDGVPTAQNLRGRGTFAQLDALLVNLALEHPRFLEGMDVAVTLVPATVEHLANSIQYFLERGVANVDVSPTFGSSGDWRVGDIKRLDTEFDRIFRMSRAHYLSTGRVPFEPFRQESAASEHRPQGRSMCGVGRGQTPTVDVDGEVHACATFADSFQTLPEFLRDRLDSVRLGPVTDPALDQRRAELGPRIQSTEIFDHKERKFSSYDDCGSCEYLERCSICPVSIGNIPGNQDPHRVPDFACAYNKVVHAHGDRFREETHPRFLLYGERETPVELMELSRLAASLRDHQEEVAP